MVIEPADTQAFEDFFRIQYPKLVTLARGLIGDHDAACDLAQEALLRCHTSWDRVSTLDVPGAWVRRVVINLARDAHRSQRRRFRARAIRPFAPTLLNDPVIDGWWTAVRQLPERQRAVVALHYLEDLSVLDVANVLGIAEGTVKATLAQARQTLARTIVREG